MLELVEGRIVALVAIEEVCLQSLQFVFILGVLLQEQLELLANLF